MQNEFTWFVTHKENITVSKDGQQERGHWLPKSEAKTSQSDQGVWLPGGHKPCPHPCEHMRLGRTKKSCQMNFSQR